MSDLDSDSLSPPEILFERGKAGVVDSGLMKLWRQYTLSDTVQLNVLLSLRCFRQYHQEKRGMQLSRTAVNLLKQTSKRNRAQCDWRLSARCRI